MSLSASTIDSATKTMLHELEWAMVQDSLVKLGWTRVRMTWPARMSAVDAHAVREWCRANIVGNYKGRAQEWIFEDPQDATLFALRFS